MCEITRHTIIEFFREFGDHQYHWNQKSRFFYPFYSFAYVISKTYSYITIKHTSPQNRYHNIPIRTNRLKQNKVYWCNMVDKFMLPYSDEWIWVYLILKYPRLKLKLKTIYLTITVILSSLHTIHTFPYILCVSTSDWTQTKTQSNLFLDSYHMLNEINASWRHRTHSWRQGSQNK